jgi:hypothetical protein
VKWFIGLFVYFSTVYRKLQLQEAGASTEDWQMMSTLLGESKAHLVVQIWQLVLADKIFNEDTS